MRIVVTGAGGFLGREVVTQLGGKGNHVIGVGRRPLAALERSFEGADFEYVRGDLLDLGFAIDAVHDADVVIHAAAHVTTWDSFQRFYDGNVVTTMNVIEACRGSGSKLVHVSSPSVVTTLKRQHRIDESAPYSRPLGAYVKTKQLAERRVLESDLSEKVVVRPRAIYGPGDTTILPGLVRALEKGELPVIGSGDQLIDLTFIADAASACILAAARALLSGAVFNITSDDPQPLREILGAVCDARGLQFPRRQVPLLAAYWAAAAAEWGAAVSLRPPRISRHEVVALGKETTFDIASARALLGYSPEFDFGRGLKETLEHIDGDDA